MYWLIIAVIFLGAGCSSTNATRMEAAKVTDLSGMWNDSDARMVADEMIKDCLQGRWIDEFEKSQGKSPVVIVGTVKNKTSEHISPDVFVSSMERALTNSGKVVFVASKEARNEVRDERADQLTGNTEPQTVSVKGHETGADFMLQGIINQIEDETESQTLMVSKRRSTNFFQVTLELVDMKTNQKRWIGQKQVKKSIERSKIF